MDDGVLASCIVDQSLVNCYKDDSGVDTVSVLVMVQILSVVSLFFVKWVSNWPIIASYS